MRDAFHHGLVFAEPRITRLNLAREQIRGCAPILLIHRYSPQFFLALNYFVLSRTPSCFSFEKKKKKEIHSVVTPWNRWSSLLHARSQDQTRKRRSDRGLVNERCKCKPTNANRPGGPRIARDARADVYYEQR